MSTAAKRQNDPNGLSDDLGTMVSETEPIVLTARDWQFFLKEWDNPGKPRPRLEEAVRRYRSLRLPDAG